ncbi:DNA helicase UvrD [Pasteurella multocida]|uniref:DNA helicase UvrD n=1 Tax=Pasteurella multocida TaxID=747 RepID=UPI002A53ED99|nr:DNA helicase UvrD [Pasteurella multocida]MDY0489656.1 DNA helicase UvrD [Pasteurella multocida]MDY0669923.1 DNA helicase UvrD [Pasteurella multocida]MDY0690411.1 DNA helicase UvrD [Pasteurella multocida]MDY0721527.1 DNA helicase UvrD [Pasteurella multocida]MEB4493950.1 DNA helicase UvrD [Pasteurella multocida]
MAIQFRKLKRWSYHVVIAIDQLFNALTWGSPDETLSSRAYRGAVLAGKPKKKWKFFHAAINKLFFWQNNHCKQAYLSEVERRQLPREFSKV